MTADLLHLLRWSSEPAPERIRIPEPGRGPIVVPYRSAQATASSTSAGLNGLRTTGTTRPTRSEP